MNTITLFKNIKTVFTLLILAGLISACSNSTSGDDHEHEEPAGFVLKMNGQSIITQMPNETSVTGEFELTPGQETDLITIYFLAEDGDEFQPHADEGYSLAYEFEDEGLVEFEQHSEDGAWSFHLHAADTAGVTDLRLKLDHNGHSDFTTQPIHVHVEAAE